MLAWFSRSQITVSAGGDQGAEGTHVGAETGDMDHGMALADEGGQAFLELVVQHHVAA